jgi:hypothetical protein
MDTSGEEKNSLNWASMMYECDQGVTQAHYNRLIR